jgi:protein-disulfide isomerase
VSSDRVLNAVLVIVGSCAVALTATAIWRTRPPTIEPTTPVRNWAELAGAGRQLGAADPRVSVVVFSDYQCPFCATFAATLDTLLERHPNALRVVHRHWPLDNIHPYARRAAFAAECAGRQGRFAEISRRFYRQQDSIGSIPWTTFALDAGITDTVPFVRCMADPSVASEIMRDEAAVRDIGGLGTPTVVVDGHMYAVPPSLSTLEAILAKATSR